MNLHRNAMQVIATILLSVTASLAQSEGGGEQVIFGDGLLMDVPPGWKTSGVDTTSEADENAGSPQETIPVKLLLHAHPPDPGRASLTVLRDESFGIHVKPQSVLGRLEEIAGVQGYRAEQPSTQGDRMTKDPVILGEIVGVSADGERRVFVCLTITRFPSVLLRCYWQWDERDGVMRDVFEQWLATAKFGGQLLTQLMGEERAGLASNIPNPSPEGEPGASPENSSGSEGETGSENTASEEPEPVVLSAAATSLASKTQESLIVVEGANGRGSGFVCQLQDGKPYVMTNAHVMSSNPDPRFNTMSGETLTPGAAALGVNSDIFRALAAEGTPALEMMTKEDGAVKIGDKIAVLGNSEGAGVVTILEGNIVGLGPNLVEVDAPFVSGNSGSPIIHLETGKVIGIATYLLIREVDKENKSELKTVVRRFGYRPGQVKDWEPINWARFYSQSAQVDRIKETSAEFIKLFSYSQEGKLSSGAFSNSGIQRAIETLERSGRSGVRVSASDRSKNYRTFLSGLKVAAMRDIEGFDSRNAYDYFRREVEEEKRFRDDISESFSRLIKSHR